MRTPDMTGGLVQGLANGCSYALGPCEDETWYPVLDVFEDATIFQTPAFCRAKAPGSRLEQLVVRRGPDVVAAALVRLIPVPFARTSIAYVLWGPVFHRRGCGPDLSALRQALEILRDEYVVKRGIGLRLAPSVTRDDGADWIPLLQEQGYRHVSQGRRKRTIVIDLDPPLDALRRGLDQKWRNRLNSAEKQHLVIRQGGDHECFELFLEVYRDMLARKRLAEPGDIRSFRAAQAMLPDRFKLEVFVAFEDGAPSAAVICSAIGRRGVFAFGATSATGMKNKASYLLQWRVIEWLKQRGCAVYDLHGADPEANPGVYAFKMGLCGKNGSEAEFYGHFEASEGVRTSFLLTAADRANSLYKRLKTLGEQVSGFRA
jgi:lipid II:glycine glycyltransferase (peptidoglycan interpeptide bridge formation enzyme)